MLFIIMSMLGALSRFYVSLVIHNVFATISVNLIGAFLMGYCASYFKAKLKPAVYKAITTGFLGSFTTFSTFSKETVTLLQSSQWLLLTVYLHITIIGGFLVCMLGVKVGRR
ncbi:fluoride efflux transporter FluC [Macrococcus armenti]|uniref:fluoride efflux transporter FluC n=1 Tax=Macrococcus armenti TaxID=2875764 RepID=UPI001CC9DFEA|nr:CrcB family protein [Macrococcus armenti]UBH14785.1 CrcB family protein [Macrococcus armenti]UBH17144.1 CrcB family protein [Macrococcus armenti]UBH19409.1 CrcB family protein [Macrococcus armenti]